MVAMGRKDGNDKPSIDSSSVITSYGPAGNSRSTLAIRNGCLNTTVSRRDRVIVMIILADWPRGVAITAPLAQVAQAPFSSSGSVPIENSIGLHGAWKALKLFFFFLRFIPLEYSSAPAPQSNTA
jgi:hypothetical protein